MPNGSIGAIAEGTKQPFTDLVLERIALCHQIAVLKRCGTCRPYFRWCDRLFWMFLSWLWPGWRGSLMIVQPETVLRWRRQGWSVFWRYRGWGHWRGGRPRIALELRLLIRRMARENFLWGAPRIHGELLMLGFKVSQATVSRCMPPPYARRGQSWRTFLRNQLPALPSGQGADGEEDSCSTIFFEHNGLPRSIPPRTGSSPTRSRVLWSGRPHARVYRLATRPGRRISALCSCHSSSTTRRNPQTEARASPRDYQSNLNQVSILTRTRF
jgi:hypothetical protein